MKKNKLIEILNSIEGDLDIILAKDSEGNNFSPLANYSENLYEAETTCYGAIYPHQPDDEGDYVPENADDVIVLWPTN